MTWLSNPEYAEALRPSREKARTDKPRVDKIIELVAVILLGLTTVGTAWCGFQAAKWSSAAGDLARQASDQNIESARLFGLATQKISYDSLVVSQYAQAVASRNTKLQTFYRNSLVRSEFRPVLQRWEAEVAAGRSPVPLSDDTAYLAEQLGPYRASVALAETDNLDSQQASDNSGDYIRVTILLAVALFFAGVTSSFSYRPARALLLAAALATLAVAAGQLAGLPLKF